MRLSGLRCAAAHSNNLEIPNNFQIKRHLLFVIYLAFIFTWKDSIEWSEIPYLVRWNAGHYRFGSPCEIITGLPEGVIFRSKEQVN
jgi:hypothetical protein